MNPDVMIDEVIEMVGSNRLRFPSPPTLVARINAVLADPNSSLRDIVHLVQTHPVLSARILQVANSAALNVGHDILTLDEATLRLGSSFVRNLALSLTLQEQFRSHDELVDQLVREVWKHSVNVGGHCFMLALMLEEAGIAKLDSSVALLVGIIHSLGELPLVDFANKKKYNVQEVLSVPDSAKRRLTGLILERWDVPEVIRKGVMRDGQYGHLLEYSHQFLESKNQEIEAELGVTYESFAEYVNNKKETLKAVISTFG